MLAIQKIVLDQCLVRRYAGEAPESGTQADEASEPLKMSEVFRTLTDGIWSELAEPSADAKDKASSVALSTIRRNLQREHLRRLGTMVLGDRSNRSGDSLGFMFFFGSAAVPADAARLARLHLKEIDGRIGKVLARKDVQVDDTTRAHLEECHNQIDKVLDAAIDPERALTDLQSLNDRGAGTEARLTASRPVRVLSPDRAGFRPAAAGPARPASGSGEIRTGPAPEDRGPLRGAARPGLPAWSPVLRRGGRSGIPGKGASSRV